MGFYADLRLVKPIAVYYRVRIMSRRAARLLHPASDGAHYSDLIFDKQGLWLKYFISSYLGAFEPNWTQGTRPLLSNITFRNPTLRAWLRPYWDRIETDPLNSGSA